MNTMLLMSGQQRNYNDNVSITHWANAMAALKALLVPAHLPYKETHDNSSQLPLSISKSANCTDNIETALIPMSINQSTSSTIPPTTFFSTSPPPKRQRIEVPQVDLGESEISFVTDETKLAAVPNPTPPSNANIDRIRREVLNILE